MSSSSSRAPSPSPTKNGMHSPRSVPQKDIRDSAASDVEPAAPTIAPPAQGPAADPPFSHGFFDKDEASTQVRKGYFKALVGFTVFTSVFIWGVVSIYWGAFWKGRTGAHNLHGWVVDFDGGAIGQAVTQAFQAATGPKDSLTWVVRSPSDFPNGAADIAKAVGDSHPWAAVAIHNGATSALSAAISSADASYNGSTAITAYGNQARNENAYNSIIQPELLAVLTQVAQKFAAQQARQLANSSADNLATLLTRAPQVVTQPVYFTIANVHPFDIPVATAVTFVGLIYLLVISFIIVNATAGMRAQFGLERRLRTSSLIRVRLATDITLFFFLSLAFSFISLFFQVSFRRHYGNAGFFIYWMLSWCGMSALGLALDAMFTLVTQRFVGYFMVFFIIFNVSVCSMPVEIQPTIYRYGRAAPFYNVSMGVRSLLFGTANHLGQNFGILLAWIAVSLITLPLFQFLRHREAIRAAQQQAQNRQISEKA